MNSPRQRRSRRDKYDPYDSDSFAAVRGKKDLIYSGLVDDRLLVFLWDNLLNAGTRLDKSEGMAKEGRRLFINSTGGCTYTMSSIIDLFEEVDDLTVVATGACMSATVPIIAAGTPGKRLATHRTRFMLHPSWEIFEHPMELEDIDAEKGEFEAGEDAYSKIMSRYCHQSYLWWRKKLSKHKSWYFDAEKALELGIIDRIIPDKLSEIKQQQRTRRKKSR